MFLDFLSQLMASFIKLPFSYISWQSHETFTNLTAHYTFYLMLFVFVLSMFM